MTRFVNEYLPSRIVGYPAEVGPAFSTQLTVVDSGSEQANSRWLDPVRSVNLPNGVRDHASFEDLKSHWLIMRGPGRTWPFRDPSDFASVELEKINHAPTVAGDDCPIGTGDGIAVAFQLSKRYTVGAETYDRPIHFPVVASVVVFVDGADPSALSPPLGYTVSRPGGVVTFDAPVPVGLEVTAGFLFDLQVRYEDDETFRGIMRTFGVSGFADIPLMEVRYCED